MERSLLSPDGRQRLALALIWLTPALWAVNFIIARSAPGVVAPHQLALGRWLIAGLILGFLARAELLREWRGLLAVWPQYLCLGALGMMICGAWVYQGAQTTVAMNISLIYAAAPVLIAMGAALLLHERLSLTQWLGVPLALAGLMHVAVKGRWEALSEVQWVIGDGWIVLAMIAWAGYALLQKIWPSQLGATARLSAICAAGVLCLLPFAIWEAGLPSTPPWSYRATGLVLLAALAPGIAAYWIYGWAQKILGASRVAVTLYLSPLYAALASWAVLGEPLDWHHLGGAALILPGVFLATYKRSV